MKLTSSYKICPFVPDGCCRRDSALTKRTTHIILGQREVRMWNHSRRSAQGTIGVLEFDWVQEWKNVILIE